MLDLAWKSDEACSYRNTLGKNVWRENIVQPYINTFDLSQKAILIIKQENTRHFLIHFYFNMLC
jgi:hypothetical protein